MRCLVTGCEGFLGSHLADLLVGEGQEVVGLVFQDTGNLDHLKGRIATVPLDLRNRDLVQQVVKDTQPDTVFHLAAQSFPTVSWEDPELTLTSNVLGTFHLLEALKEQRSEAAVTVVTSSAVYGACSPDEMPMGEEREFRPTSIYAVSKVSEDMLGYFYWQAYGLNVIRVRPFNMTGPRKVDDAVSDFARGVAAVEKGRCPSLTVGNLEAVRDYSDGRDGVAALWLLAQRGQPGTAYNVCSGQGRTLRSILQELIAVAQVDIAVEVSPSKIRPHDDPIYVGDCSKLRGLGWKPQIPFAQTLADTLNYWRQQEDNRPCSKP